MSILGIIASSKYVAAAPVAGYKVWLDASDTSTITSSSGAVSKWTDKSANAYTFSQGTAAYKPTTGVDTQNGKNVLTFASNDALVCDQAKSNFRFLYYTTYSVFIVAKYDSAATNIIYSSNAGSSSNIGVIFYTTSSDGLQHQGTRGVSASFIYQNISSSSVTSTAFTYYSLYGDSASGTSADRSKVQVKQGSVISNNTAYGAVTNTDASDFLRIGDYVNAGGAGIAGKIAEILIYDTELSAANVLKNQQYLADKWSIT
jgi:roadblock/LC7 domain-containing protein